MATLKERRESDKRRVKAWRERQAKEGKKNLSVTISQKVHKILLQQKEKTGETNSEIVERALLSLNNHE